MILRSSSVDVSSVLTVGKPEGELGISSFFSFGPAAADVIDLFAARGVTPDLLHRIHFLPEYRRRLLSRLAGARRGLVVRRGHRIAAELNELVLLDLVMCAAFAPRRSVIYWIPTAENLGGDPTPPFRMPRHA